MKIMKTKISHLLVLLTLVAVAILIEKVFLQSMVINNQAYDLIANTAISSDEAKVKNLNLMKMFGKVALADTAVPLFPGAKRLTFSDNGLVRYRINAPINMVTRFYNQVMSSAGWRRIKSSAQAITTKENINKVMIALAENPITKKTEAIFYHQPLSGNDILGAQKAQASDTVDSGTSQFQPPIQPQSPEPVQTQPQFQSQEQFQPQLEGQRLMPLGDNQINQTAPTNNQTQPFSPEGQPTQPGTDQYNNNAPQPTCRVNGVEVPGACPQYNNGSDMRGMEFGRSGGEQSQWQGPSEEDNQKMDERRLQDMKRGMNQFTRSIAMMKKSVARTKVVVSKCGVSIPEELVNALNSSDSLVAKINNAKTADELDEVVGDIEDIGSVMQDWGPRMGDLNRLCQMLKQADRDLKQLDRSLKRYQAKNSAKLDLSEILAEYKTNVDNMRQALSQAKELAKTDPAEALTKIEDDFYGNMDNVRNSEQAINMVLNISRGIRQASAEIKKIERDIKNLKKKKIDTAQLEELLADFKVQLGDIKNLVKGKFDADELISKVETTFDTLEQIFDAMQEYGLGIMEPKIKENKSLNMQINLPDAFKKQGGNEGDNSGQSDNPNSAGTNNLQPQNMMPKI